MIPNIVHYCWFGGKEKPEDVQKCIATWKEKMPQYQFQEWNEEKFNVQEACDYVREAYEAKKYAFVSDYVRIKALYENGGIYFDTDVEVLKSFEEKLGDYSLVTGFESERSLLTAFIAVEKGHPYMKEFLDSYEERHFLMEDGSYDMTVINEGFSKLLEAKGIQLEQNTFQSVNGVAVYPIDIFCGFDVSNWHEAITENTCTVHHMEGSWMNQKMNLKKVVIKLLQKLLGYKIYDKIKGSLKKG